MEDKEIPVIQITEPERIKEVPSGYAQLEILNYDNSHIIYKGKDLGTFIDLVELKKDKELYEYMYIELRKQWNKVIDELLGKDYYNYGCDHYSCDKFTADDLIYKYKRKRWWQFWKVEGSK